MTSGCSVAGADWQIEHQCPQCGGPVTLGETDRLLSCPYCRVRLYLACDGVFQYALPAREAIGQDLFRIPYWRVKGQVFSCVPYEVKTGVIDMTRCAVGLPGLPSSLGVRPQAMKLRFAANGISGAFLRPEMSESEAVRNCESTYNELYELTVFDQAFIGETVSLVYFPIAMRDGIYDAVIGRKIAPLPASEIDPSALAEGDRGGILRFLPPLCPHCGWDLDFEKDSLALLCHHCQSLWEAKGLGLRRLAFGLLDADFEPDRYLPFWRTKPTIEGVALRTFADLVRFANLPKVVREEWEMQELALWTPAFKVHPRNLIRIAKTMTLAQPDAVMAGALPKSAYHPVNLPPAESADCIKVLLAEFARPKQKLFPRLGGLSVGAADTTLIFVPFQDTGTEVRHAGYRICIPRNLLEYGRNL